MVGDRILIKPKNAPNKTRSGLYLPPGVQENEKIHSGYVIKVGWYPIPGNLDEEPWMEKKGNLKIYSITTRRRGPGYLSSKGF